MAKDSDKEAVKESAPAVESPEEGESPGEGGGEEERGGPLMTLAWVGVVFVIGFVILVVLGQLPELL